MEWNPTGSKNQKFANSMLSELWNQVNILPRRVKFSQSKHRASRIHRRICSGRIMGMSAMEIQINGQSHISCTVSKIRENLKIQNHFCNTKLAFEREYHLIGRFIRFVHAYSKDLYADNLLDDIE